MDNGATVIVNLRHAKADVYCGRGSIFGNPYVIGQDGTRDEVCDKFEEYFQNKLRDPKFRAKVLALKNKKLGCWCKPLRCHVETIVKYIEGV